MARHRPTQNPYTRPAIFTLERLHAELGGAILEDRQKYDEMSEQMREDASKEDVQNVSLGIQHSLANHDGKGVERVGEARPYRWRLKD